MRKMTFVFALLASSIVASDAFASLKVTLFAPNNQTVEINDTDAGQSAGLVSVASRTVGGYTFTFTAASSTTTGLVTLHNMSVLTAAGTAAGKVGILVSSDNAPMIGSTAVLQSNAGVTTASGASNSQAAVSYSAYVDTANSIATVTYSGGNVSVNNAGTLVTNKTGNITSPLGNPNDSWFDSGVGSVALSGATNVTMNLLVMADFSRINAGSAASHRVQFNGSLALSPVPEPASLSVWGLGGLLGLAVRRRYA